MAANAFPETERGEERRGGESGGTRQGEKTAGGSEKDADLLCTQASSVSEILYCIQTKGYSLSS